MLDPEGNRGSGPPTPEKITKNIGFLSNAGPDPPKNQKPAKPAFNVGPSSTRRSLHLRTPVYLLRTLITSFAHESAYHLRTFFTPH